MATQSVRRILDINEGWRFARGDYADACSPDFDDSAWRTVRLPHDWSIEGPFSPDNPSAALGGYLPGGIGWYRLHVTLPAQRSGRRLFLQFGAIYRNSDVWVNGRHVGFRPNGYVELYYDITPFVNAADTCCIAVRVDNEIQPASRWYTGAGIYQTARLILLDEVYIDQRQLSVVCDPVSAEAAAVSLAAAVRNESGSERALRLECRLLAPDGSLAAAEQAEVIAAPGESRVTLRLSVSEPELWSDQKPALYTAQLSLKESGGTRDTFSLPVGIRSAVFDADRGFLLNGRPLKLKGVCLHHDNGCLGAEAWPRAEQRKLELIKSMGANAIRTSHNPPSENFLSLCDQMGILVMEELFDEWLVGKWPMTRDRNGNKGRKIIHNYAALFPDWHERDLRDIVRRDRNHPSVILWSTGNEIMEQRFSMLDGIDTSLSLKALVHEEDPSRPVTCGCCFGDGAKGSGFYDTLDVVGYNYAESLYRQEHERCPSRRMIGSETTSMTPFWPRGTYDLKVLSGINHAVDLGEGEVIETDGSRFVSAEYSMRMHMQLDYVAGFFIWTGMDYLGEPIPFSWPSRSSYFGSLDTAGLPKDSYYFYRAFWQDEPVLHLFPHWNWTGLEGQLIPVLAYSNCDSIELFLNGCPLGEQHRRDDVLHYQWEVPYSPGVLTAVGKRGGVVCCEERVATAGEPARISLTADRAQLAADGRDLLYVTLSFHRSPSAFA